MNAAIECLTLTLNAHPLNDLAIVAWAAERQAILAAQCKAEQTREDWLRRFGEVNPAVREPTIVGVEIPPTYVAPSEPIHGRPHETRMDAANALLLRAHPVLAHAPLHFAMLEALFGLDTLETVRFPSPRTWRDNPELAEGQRDTVRRRACARIKRALKVNADAMVEGASNLVGVDYS